MILFPGFFGPADLTDETLPYYMGTILDQTRNLLEDQVARGFCFECPNDSCCVMQEDCINRAKSIVEKLMVRLPHIRRFLFTDVQAAYEGDPAAPSPDEVIFCYPGLLAITNHRIAHELYNLRVPLIPRIISEHVSQRHRYRYSSGCGDRRSFFHGPWNRHCHWGKHAESGVMSGSFRVVTLGAIRFPLDSKGKPVKGIERHPIVEDNVVIYSGATLLGRITIGNGSIIGGNIWLTKSVPPNSKITQKQATRGNPTAVKAEMP